MEGRSDGEAEGLLEAGNGLDADQPDFCVVEGRQCHHTMRNAGNCLPLRLGVTSS